MSTFDCEEIGKIVSEFNNTDVEYNKSITIQELFQKQVEKNPDAVALIFKEQFLTYKELDEKSNSLAWVLREMGVKADDVIGIMTERSLEMIIGIFAIIKAGGAYMPLSPQNPVKRNEYMLCESKCKILLTQKPIDEELHFEGTVVSLGDEKNYSYSKRALPLINHSRNLAYVIFTSGSTGNPKGAMIEHRSLVNRLDWMQKKYPISGEDTLIQKTPYSFDVSVWEIFWWSLAGAKLCILNPGMEKFPLALIECINKNHVTVIHFVPSMLNMFLSHVRASNEQAQLASLRQVFVSGEALTVQQVKSFNQLLYKSNSTKLANLYGPTEATVDVTYYDCPVSDDIDKIPIGKPINNTKILIVKDDKPQAVGEPGEICILGDGLARGYLNRDDLTDKSFVKSLLSGHSRMYKTGDIGQWLPDGNIEYLGRADFQVKIRGLRIELMEIEAVIDSYSEGINSVVVVNKVSETIINIVAFIACERDISIPDLKAHLKARLPEYMIPNKFITIKELPVTANGKADRKKLQELYL